MRNNRNSLYFVFLLLLSVYASSAYALKFHSYVNEKGETVYSNVPRNCTRNSSLTCLEYHPVIKQSGNHQSIANHDSGNAGKINQAKKQQKHQRQSPGNPYLTDTPSIDQQFDLLNNIVEMNKLMDEYFPAPPDPQQSRQVRQQQQDILNVLQSIKNLSSEEESPSIEKAINILRSNLVE
jgi:hypothetical protein